jgi:hypothetical protein
MPVHARTRAVDAEARRAPRCEIPSTSAQSQFLVVLPAVLLFDARKYYFENIGGVVIVLRFSSLAACAVILSVTAALAADTHPSAAEPGSALVVAQAGASKAQKNAFEAAKELGTVEAWDAFLSNYPDGFYADLARAYVKKLAEPSTSNSSVTPPSEIAPKLAPAQYGPGDSDWTNTTMSFVANSSRRAYAAVVDADGVQMTAFCHKGAQGPQIVAGLRVTGSDPGVLERLRQGLAAAPSVTNDLSRMSMSFANGSTIDGVAASTPPKDNEVTLYVDRKLLDPDDDVLEQLMAGQEVTLSAPPFSASFQLDGSRSALCSMMNKCGAKAEGCGSDESSERSCGRGQYRDRKGRCVDEDNGQDEKINCGRGRTWVGAQGKCVCVDGNAHWNGKRCVTRRGNGPRGCTGGRTFDRQIGQCVCNGDSAWNGRACVKEPEPPPNNGQNNNNAQMKQAVCSAFQIACNLGNKSACNKFNNGCR